MQDTNGDKMAYLFLDWTKNSNSDDILQQSASLHSHNNNKKSQSNLGKAVLPPLMAENNYSTKSHIYPKTVPSPFMITTLI